MTKKNLTDSLADGGKLIFMLAVASLLVAFPSLVKAGNGSPAGSSETPIRQTSEDAGEYELRKDQIVCSFLPVASPYMQLICIDRDKKETRVTIAVPVTTDDHWFRFDSNFSIRDMKRGDIYRIRSLTRGMPLNQKLSVSGMRGRMMEFTLVFPPLPSKVKDVEIFEYTPGSTEYYQNEAHFWHLKNIKVKSYRPEKERELYYSKDGTPKTSRGMEFGELTRDQIVPSPLPFTSRPVIQRIETDKKETRITVAVPIYWDHVWITHSKGFCMVDSKRGTAYKIKSLTRGIELNKILWINGHRGEMIEFTMVFPPLKSRVKYIDLYTKYPNEGTLIPLDAAEPWQWRNIRVKDYEQQTGKIIY